MIKNTCSLFSDWNDENPAKTLANLKRNGHYYAFKKNTVQSWDQVIKHHAVRARLKQAWDRMEPMDFGDVGYDVFLMNGKQRYYLKDVKRGQRVLLRIINAAASTYFHLNYAGGPMEVVAADGMYVKPYNTKRLLIAIAETYDVIVTIPKHHAYEFRATAQDGTGYASAYIGTGSIVAAKAIPKPNLFKMDHGMHANMQHKSHQHHAHHQMPHGSYAKLRSLHKTALNPNNPTRTIRLELTGNMNRYTWTFNKKTLHESDNIQIKKGENVIFVLVNKTMMHHPLHLHGHFFRVLNGHGDYSPLKHTVDIPPMKTVKIEFYANEKHDWFFHCHNLYHMSTGMARVISYMNSPTDPELQAHATHILCKKGKDFPCRRSWNTH